MLILVEQDYLDMLNNLNLILHYMYYKMNHNLNKHFHFSKYQWGNLRHRLILIMLNFLNMIDSLLMILNKLHNYYHMIYKYYLLKKYQ